MNPTGGESMRLAFVGGGNMARAIIGGLRAANASASIVVVEPVAELREALARDFGATVLAHPGPLLRDAQVVVWAVKPQSFAQAAAAATAHVSDALQLSIMAGIRSDAIARAAGTSRVVRSMPNTPALIGQGIAGLYARPDVDAAGRAAAERVLAPTGQLLWVEREEQLDAVTALSGSGPAYVFYLLEALVAGGEANGLSASQAKRLALGTLAGATELAARSKETPAQLRERVTSKGGTTHAALEVMRQRGVGDAVIAAVAAATVRARELGDELARDERRPS
jgi:pyrroline-5-carboxylate reductase